MDQQFDYTKLPDYSVVHPMVEMCSEADEILSHIIKVYETGKNAIISSYARLQKAFSDEKLKNTPLTQINNGIDITTLTNAGITTVYDLLNSLKPETFRGMPFAQSSALQTRAKILEQSLKDRFVLKIVPGSQDSDINNIVAFTAQLLAVNPYYDKAKQLYNDTHSKLCSAIPLAERQTPRLVWLLNYGMAIRRTIWEAVFDVEKIAKSDILREAKQLQDECKNAIERCWNASYWSLYEHNSATFYAFLEALVGKPKTNPLGFNYSSEGPAQPISGETTTQTQSQPQSPSKLGIPVIPGYVPDPELAELEKRVEILVQSVDKYPLNTSKLTARLRSYQEFAAKYILHQRQVLLGDEMGLGKTVEAIAAMAHLAASGETHFMVVCPLSVLVNWEREIERHSTLPKWIVHGSEAQKTYNLWRRYGGVIITTYDVLKKLNAPERQIISLIVVDEAHYVKNPKAERTHALLDFKKAAKRALFMTGTPMENKIKEMIFLIRCLRPDIADEIDCSEEKPDAVKFRLKISPVYLRRTRDDVLTELPEKEEIEDWCTMTNYEKNAYQHSLAVDTYMTLRRLSWNLPDITYSSKAKKMMEICDDARDNNRKVIIFSYFKDTLKVAEKMLGNRCFGPIDGSVPNAKRQAIIDRFTQGPGGSVLLCQVLAGGVGLNIQAASVVIFCEPQWKPSTEEQAIARAYRMGQVNRVFVHRILMEDTIDEYILAILKGKAKDIEVFANMSEAGIASMTELRMMNDIVEYEAKRLGITRMAKL